VAAIMIQRGNYKTKGGAPARVTEIRANMPIPIIGAVNLGGRWIDHEWNQDGWSLNSWELSLDVPTTADSPEPFQSDLRSAPDPEPDPEEIHFSTPAEFLPPLPPGPPMPAADDVMDEPPT
jgi:hypothetical protein